MRLSAKSLRPALVAIALSVTLSGCGSFKGVQKLLGTTEDTILPGQREEVMATTTDITPDPTVSAVPIVVPAAQTNQNWSQPGGVPSNALQHVALGPQPQRAWSSSAGTGSSSQGRLTASPIVSNGRIFVLDTQATLRAFDASSGGAVWSKALTPNQEESDEGYGGGVASDGRKVYVTTAFGNVMAFLASSGELVWGKRLDSPIRSAPTVADGRVFVSTISNEVFALSAEDGFTQWKFDGVGETASLLTSTSPAVRGDTVVVPYTSGEIIAFSAATGRPLWGDSLVRTGALSSLASMNDISGRPVIEGGQAIAIGHSGRMVAIDVTSGERIWSKNISGTQTPWVAGPFIFVISGTQNLMAVTRDQGLVRWTKELPGDQIWSGPVLAGGRLFAVSSKGIMAQVNVQDGSIISQSDIGAAMFIAPIVAGNTIYLLTDDATLIAMR